MKKISIVVQGDEAISNRQRVVVNPERFRSVPELLQVLSMELKQPDGSPLILPPSTMLSILQSSTGTFVPLVDVRSIEDSSRLQVHTSQQHDSKTKTKHMNSADGTGADRAAGRAAGAGIPIEKGTELYDLLLYHCKIVAYLSANLHVDKEITVQDIQAVADDPQTKARQVMDQLVGSRVDAISSAKILTQLALQRGKSDREQSDGSATVKMRQTLSAYQHRIDRLEAELAKATDLYETTLARLNAVLVERERTTSDLTSAITSQTSEVSLKTEEINFLRECAQNFQRDMSDMNVAPGGSSQPSLTPAAVIADVSKKKQSSSDMPSSLNEEKYLRIVDPDRPLRKSLQLATIAENIERLQIQRPSTTGGSTTLLRANQQQQPSSGKRDVAESSSQPSAEVCIQCNLLLLSGGSRVEPIFVDSSNPMYSKFVDQFYRAFANDFDAGRAEFEFSYFRNGTRHTIKTSQDLSAFLRGGRVAHDGRPRSVALNCVELQVNNALGSSFIVSPTAPVAGSGMESPRKISLTPVTEALGLPDALSPANKTRFMAAKFFGKDTSKMQPLRQAADQTALTDHQRNGGTSGSGADTSSPGNRPKTSDALSTRNFFLSVGPVPVPTDDSIRCIFSSLADGTAAAVNKESTRVSKARAVQYLTSKYETYGDSKRFAKAVEQACPADTHLTLDQFSMVLLRVVRE